MNNSKNINKRPKPEKEQCFFAIVEEILVKVLISLIKSVEQ